MIALTNFFLSISVIIFSSFMGLSNAEILKENACLLSSQRIKAQNGSINGHVFVKRNDITETPVPAIDYNYKNVEVYLSNKCAGGQVIAQTITDVAGDFVFLGLDSGEYLVTIDDKNSLIPLQATDRCVTIDSSIIQVSFGYKAMACDVLTSSTQYHELSPLDCDISEWNDACVEFYDRYYLDTVRIDGCVADSVYKSSWFQFHGGIGNYYIDIFPSFGDSSFASEGYMIGLYDGSANSPGIFDSVIWCSAGCTTDIISIPSSYLTPGRTYYLHIGACSHAAEVFKMKIRGDFRKFDYTGIDTIGLVNSCSDTIYSLFNIYDFELVSKNGFELETNDFNDFYWSLTDPTGFITPWVSNSNYIDLFFSIPGTYKLCIDKVTNYCVETEAYCIQFEVIEADKVTDFGKYYLCKSSFPWDGKSKDLFGNLPIDKDKNQWGGAPIEYGDFVLQNGNFNKYDYDECKVRELKKLSLRLLATGAPCDDQNLLTEEDMVDENCECKGRLINHVDDDKSLPITIYPNPVTHRFTIHDPSSNIIEVKLYNVLGELLLIKSNLMGTSHEIDISNLVSGIYVMQLTQKPLLNAAHNSIGRIVKL